MPPRCFNHNPVTGDALRRVHVHFSHRSGIGPARDVPAPPLAHGVRTRKGRNLLQPTGKRHPYHSPRLRPVNTEPRGDTGTRSFFRVGLRTSQSLFCIREKWPDRAKHLLSRPLLCRPKGVSVCSVVKKVPLPSGLHVVKQRASQPQSHSPCPRVSVHSVLTGRRPTVRHAPRRRGYIARQAIVNQPKTRPLQETAFSHKPRHANRC